MIDRPIRNSSPNPISRPVLKFLHYLESRWAIPSYAGMVIGGVALCFFGAATNTMAGWLYVLSGLSLALLILSLISAIGSIQYVKLSRETYSPVHVGDSLVLELRLKNNTDRPLALFQVWDDVPETLSRSVISCSIEVISPQQDHHWIYSLHPEKRGIFRWNHLYLRSGNPLGLWWTTRLRNVPAKVVVYPEIIRLNHCPLIDTLGQEESLKLQSEQLYQNANEGITRSIRPYRQGDSMRFVHWKSSAKLGELKVRELEITTGGEEVILCLDTASVWEEKSFEQAVTAIASIYLYAQKARFQVKLWTAKTGLIHGNQIVLEALAETQFSEETITPLPKKRPLLWFTQNPHSLTQLGKGSRWVFFEGNATGVIPQNDLYLRGYSIELDRELQLQLQSPV